LTLTAVVLAVFCLAATPANAETIFTESFEKPVVTAKENANPAGWMGGGKHGSLLNTESGKFATPHGKQAASLNGSGTLRSTTALRAFVKAGMNYKLTFNAAKDKAQDNATYKVELLAGCTVVASAVSNK